MDIPLEMKYKIEKIILNNLEQEEKTDIKYIYQGNLYIEQKAQGLCYVIPTSYRLLFIEKKNLTFIDVEPSVLFIEIPIEFFNLDIKQQQDKSQQYYKVSIKEQKQANQQPRYFMRFMKFWRHIILEFKQDELKRFQMFLGQPMQITIPFTIQAKIDILQTNEQVSNLFKDTFIKKKIKMIDENMFWQNQDEYVQKEKSFMPKLQATYQTNLQQLLDYANQCILYGQKNNGQSQFQEQLILENDIIRNCELQYNEYERNRPPKKIKNKDSTNELFQEQIFHNIYQNQKINRELENQYIQIFGIQIMDDALFQNKIQQQKRILNQDFYQEIESENDGIKEEDIIQKNNMQNEFQQQLQIKRVQTNFEWEKDKYQIINQLDTFKTTQFDRLEINSIIKDDYKASYLSKNKQRFEEKEKQFFIDSRQFYSTVKRLLQFLYEGLKLKKNSEDIKEYVELLQEEIKEIRIYIQKIGRNTIDKDKYKILILEDLQKQIEKGINEFIYY